MLPQVQLKRCVVEPTRQWSMNEVVKKSDKDGCAGAVQEDI